MEQQDQIRDSRPEVMAARVESLEKRVAELETFCGLKEGEKPETLFNLYRDLLRRRAQALTVEQQPCSAP